MYTSEDDRIWETFQADLLHYLDPIRTKHLGDYRMDFYDMLHDAQQCYKDIVHSSRSYTNDSTEVKPCGMRLWINLSMVNRIKLTKIKLKVGNPLWLDLEISSYMEP